jgi:protein tyrosine phosphatase (PTP) superfamily phosphohydrolase (DUF442 family)
MRSNIASLRWAHLCRQRVAFALLLGLVITALPACRPIGSGGIAMTGSATAAPAPPPAHPAPNAGSGAGDTTPTLTDTTILEKEIPNFHVVHPTLLRGAAPTPDGLRHLKSLGVKTVIDLRISPKKVAAERALVETLGMRFINLPMSGDPPTAREVKTFLATTTDPAQPTVFVHCQHGADRTGTMIGIYREQVDGWSFDRVYREMRQYGFSPEWRRLTATVRRYAAPKTTSGGGGP